jgi:hypothetical protein
MMTIGFVMLLTASVTSVVIKNGLGTCLSYTLGTSMRGNYVITLPCNSSDPTQTNWIVSKVNNTAAMNGTITICLNGTAVCAGIRRRPIFSHILSGFYQMKLVLQDSSDLGQYWIPVQYLANNWFNGLTRGCIQTYSAYGNGGLINTARCQNTSAQSWTVNSDP